MVRSVRSFFEGWRFARSVEVWKGILDCAVDIADKKFGKQSSFFLCAVAIKQYGHMTPTVIRTYVSMY